MKRLLAAIGLVLISVAGCSSGDDEAGSPAGGQGGAGGTLSSGGIGGAGSGGTGAVSGSGGSAGMQSTGGAGGQAGQGATGGSGGAQGGFGGMSGSGGSISTGGSGGGFACIVIAPVDCGGLEQPCCDPAPCDGPNYCQQDLMCCGSSCAEDCNAAAYCTIPCSGIAPDEGIQEACGALTTMEACTSYQTGGFPESCVWIVPPAEPCLVP